MGLTLPFTPESAAIVRKQLVDWMRQLGLVRKVPGQNR